MIHYRHMKNLWLHLLAVVLAIGLLGCITSPSAMEFERFTQIEPGMSFEDLNRLVGEPFGDIGSGIHIFVYPLQDDSNILVGFTDTVLYVHQQLPENARTNPAFLTRLNCTINPETVSTLSMLRKEEISGLCDMIISKAECETIDVYDTIRNRPGYPDEIPDCVWKNQNPN